MKYLREKTLRKRAGMFLMTMLMAFCTVSPLGPFSVVAYAAGEGGEGAGGTHGIFDIIDSQTGAVNSGSEVVQTNPDGDYSTIIDRYKNVAVAIMGVLTITMLIFMLIQFTKLGAAGDNEMARKKAIMGILTTGIATALLGGSTIIVGFFWGALNGAAVGG